MSAQALFSRTTERYFHNMQSCCNLNFLDTHFVNIEKLFESHPKIFLNESNIKKFLNGVKLSGFSNFKDGLVRIYFDNSF